MVPVEVIESPAWRWLPPFARCVVVGLAAGYRGRNNGALELTEKRAAEMGLSRREWLCGLGLACEARLIVRTVPARYRGGKGLPARFALTFQAMSDLPALNLVAAPPSNAWARFAPPGRPVRSINSGDVVLGRRKVSGDFPSVTGRKPYRLPRGDHKATIR